MASRQKYTDPVECWNILAKVLSYGHTIPFVYRKDEQEYILSEGIGGWGYTDHSCAEYLMDDIKHALFDEKLKKIELTLSGRESGPICDFWTFTFTRDGLTEAYSYYNDD